MIAAASPSGCLLLIQIQMTYNVFNEVNSFLYKSVPTFAFLYSYTVFIINNLCKELGYFLIEIEDQYEICTVTNNTLLSFVTVHFEDIMTSYNQSFDIF